MVPNPYKKHQNWQNAFMIREPYSSKFWRMALVSFKAPRLISCIRRESIWRKLSLLMLIGLLFLASTRSIQQGKLNIFFWKKVQATKKLEPRYFFFVLIFFWLLLKKYMYHFLWNCRYLKWACLCNLLASMEVGENYSTSAAASTSAATGTHIIFILNRLFLKRILIYNFFLVDLQGMQQIKSTTIDYLQLF